MHQIRIFEKLITIITTQIYIFMKKISLFLSALLISLMGFAQEAWLLVTDASELAAGDQVVVVAKDYNVALSTNQKNNNRGEVAITKEGSEVIINNDVQILTIATGKQSGTFALYTGTGYLYAASSSSNYLRTESTYLITLLGKFLLSLAEKHL